MSVYVPTAPRAKAILGPGAAAMQTQPMLSANGRWLGHEQKFMKQCAALWASDPWISAAERVISSKFSTVEWHLEDADDTEIDDKYPDQKYQQPWQLLERPQKQLPPDESQHLTRREMWALTSRHMGITGNAFWYLDQLEPSGRTPLDILYIAPWRMWPVPDSSGNLSAWMLDWNENSRTGTRLELDEVIHFTFEPPEEGFFGIGLVQSAMQLAAMDRLGVSHVNSTLQGGGRLAGIVSPKDVNSAQALATNDDAFAQLVRDMRAISEAPDSAKRMMVLKGPVDFQPTAANFQELHITDLLTLGRDFILQKWGVPLSQIGGSSPAGLNSGDTKKYDEAALWQNAIHPRIVAFTESVQYNLLDRYENIGVTVELEIDEPAFDDDGPRFELLQKSQGIAMRNSERRALIGFEPVGDDAIDNAIWMPISLSQVYLAPDENGNPVTPETISPFNDPAPQPLIGAPVAQPVVSPAPAVPQIPASFAKARTLPPPTARLHASLTKLRARMAAEHTPKLRDALKAFLQSQRTDIASRLRTNADHIARKPRETDVWFSKRRWDRELTSLLQRPLTAMAQTISDHVAGALPPSPSGSGKAAPVGTVERALARGAGRVTNINARTRDAVQAFIVKGLDEGLSPAELADAIEEGVLLDNGTGAFDEYRAELIARTELMDAYNGAALGSYSDAGLSQVEAIDGDGDEECAARDGQVFDIEEADAIEDHPNGTLDWVPVIEDAPAKATEMELVVGAMKALAERPEPAITVEGPTIHNHPSPLPDIHVPQAVVNLPEPSAPRRVRKTVERDEQGRIVALVEEEL